MTILLDFDVVTQEYEIMDRAVSKKRLAATGKASGQDEPTQINVAPFDDVAKLQRPMTGLERKFVDGVEKFFVSYLVDTKSRTYRTRYKRSGKDKYQNHHEVKKQFEVIEVDFVVWWGLVSQAERLEVADPDGGNRDDYSYFGIVWAWEQPETLFPQTPDEEFADRW